MGKPLMRLTPPPVKPHRWIAVMSAGDACNSTVYVCADCEARQTANGIPRDAGYPPCETPSRDKTPEPPPPSKTPKLPPPSKTAWDRVKGKDTL